MGELENKISSVILAGGMASRLQQKGHPWQDKAMLEFKGKYLLQHSLEAVSSFSSEIIIMTIGAERVNRYRKFVKKVALENEIKIKTDLGINCTGPLRGILSGLKNCTNNICLVLPVDLPSLSPLLFKRLIKLKNEASLAVPIWGDGRLEPLVGTYDLRKIAYITAFLPFFSRGRADDIIRGALDCTLVSIERDLVIDQNPMELFRNINRPGGLKDHRPTEITLSEGQQSQKISNINSKKILDLLDIYRLKKIAEINEFDLPLPVLYEMAGYLDKAVPFWKGIIWEQIFKCTGKKEDAENTSEAFLKEALQWKKRDIKFLLVHTLQDARKYEERPSQQEYIDRQIDQLKLEMKLEPGSKNS